ncbi:hypothetical protein [Calothrix sp. 336/3]|uniref:hypothetical protein n=1 Tax=Calothrix sp. 336/3 TaxID=1337936 RepID=UPI0004E2D51B|nr:hypothetical protein [Calothrix sp. 336/3]AKG20537.1 hypothetical protein IJ00_03695 [Calothrix sp. 336/3]
MSHIKITNLHLSGKEFFDDSETFLNELTHQDITKIIGGEGEAIVSQVTYSIGMISADNNLFIPEVSIEFDTTSTESNLFLLS